MRIQIVKKVLSAQAMKNFAAKVARDIARGAVPRNSSLIIALEGELGAGKTTFVQGFLKALGVKSVVHSPTFLIIKPYHLDRRQLSIVNSHRFSRAFHIDCYRLKKSQELLALGFKEILKNPKHLVLIEWPELIKKYLPKNTHWITIHHSEKSQERTILLK